MNELLIKQNKHHLYSVPIAWVVIGCFAFFHFLGNDYSKAALMIFIFAFLIIAMLHWSVFQQSKREVIINKQENKITVLEKSYLNKEIVQSYSISSFRGVRSYLPSYQGISPPQNHIVLLYKDSDTNLLLSSFCVSSGNKFFTHGAYETNEAESLRIAVSELTGLTDFGFQNKNWRAFS